MIVTYISVLQRLDRLKTAEHYVRC